MSGRPLGGRGWIVIVGVALLVLHLVGLLAWWKLPAWAPVWVATYSPWSDPLLRVLTKRTGKNYDPARDAVFHRLLKEGVAWKGLLPEWYRSGGSDERYEVTQQVTMLLGNSTPAVKASPTRLEQVRRDLHEDLVAVGDMALAETDRELQYIGMIIGQEVADPRLIRTIGRMLDRSPGIKDDHEKNMLWALQSVRNRHAVPYLLAYLHRTGSLEGDLSAWLSLPDSARKEPLALLTSPEPRLRIWALRWLRGDERAPSFDGIEFHTVETAVLKALTDTDPEVPGEAALTCGELQLTSAIEQLRTMLRDDLSSPKYGEVRAVHALGDRSSVPLLVAKLDAQQPGTRYFVIEALGDLGDAQAVDALLRTANGVASHEASAAVEALRKLPLSEAQRLQVDEAEKKIAAWKAQQESTATAQPSQVPP